MKTIQINPNSKAIGPIRVSLTNEPPYHRVRVRCGTLKLYEELYPNEESAKASFRKTVIEFTDLARRATLKEIRAIERKAASLRAAEEQLCEHFLRVTSEPIPGLRSGGPQSTVDRQKTIEE